LKFFTPSELISTTTPKKYNRSGGLKERNPDTQMMMIKSTKVDYSTPPAIVGYKLLYLGFLKIFFFGGEQWLFLFTFE